MRIGTCPCAACRCFGCDSGLPPTADCRRMALRASPGDIGTATGPYGVFRDAPQCPAVTEPPCSRRDRRPILRRRPDRTSSRYPVRRSLLLRARPTSRIAAQRSTSIGRRTPPIQRRVVTAPRRRRDLARHGPTSPAFYERPASAARTSRRLRVGPRVRSRRRHRRTVTSPCQFRTSPSPVADWRLAIHARRHGSRWQPRLSTTCAGPSSSTTRQPHRGAFASPARVPTGRLHSTTFARNSVRRRRRNRHPCISDRRWTSVTDYRRLANDGSVTSVSHSSQDGTRRSSCRTDRRCGHATDGEPTPPYD